MRIFDCVADKENGKYSINNLNGDGFMEALLKLIPWKKLSSGAIALLVVLMVSFCAGVPPWGIFVLAILIIAGIILVLFRGDKSKAELSEGVTVKKSKTGDIQVTNKSRVNVDDSSTGNIKIEG